MIGVGRRLNSPIVYKTILLAYNKKMSRLSFKTFCLELYAEKKSIKSSEAFGIFERNGILEMLDRDYELLHGHGFDYVLNDIDTLIKEGIR